MKFICCIYWGGGIPIQNSVHCAYRKIESRPGECSSQSSQQGWCCNVRSIHCVNEAQEADLNAYFPQLDHMQQTSSTDKHASSISDLNIFQAGSKQHFAFLPRENNAVASTCCGIYQYEGRKGLSCGQRPFSLMLEQCVLIQPGIGWFIAVLRLDFGRWCSTRRRPSEQDRQDIAHGVST